MRLIGRSTIRHDALEIHILPLRSDNYSYLIHDLESKSTLVIDPSDAEPIVRYLEERRLGLDWILNTHHHEDHTEGNRGLKKHFGSKIAASAYDIEKGRIKGDPDLKLMEGVDFPFGRYYFRVLETPGHTLGHVSLYLEEARWLFTGDTLFSLGCGRLFEGDAAMLWASFRKLRRLPDDTRVFCGHEYTLSNAKFVESLKLDLPGYSEFHNGLRKRVEDEKKSIPSILGDEKRFNPYMRADYEDLLGFGSNPAEVFGRIRSLKDVY